MPSKQSEPIAIVGSGCRFPGGANSPSALWKLLEDPRDVCNEIPADRFDTTGYYHQNGSHHGLTNVRHSYLLKEDVRVFDAAFFNISPNEADSIDPQQRILLETVYEAMEAGGHTIERLKGSDTAVYVGTMGVDYNDTLLRDLSTIPTYFATGTNRAIISNRVSYFFDWHGPSMTIDTACSSSLIAVHQGVQALRSGESRVAVACGTQAILGPEVFIFESKMKMLSPTGRSRMWDADADGYARGEGVAAVVLKKLSDAIADGDYIEGVIRETGANQDGYSNGITVPSTEAQAALIRQTYARAGLDLSTLEDRPQFFEAHGTGTQAGDPKEAAAIAQCFGPRDDATSPLYVGSVKTVIGHTEGAAGLAGLLKGLKSIQSGYIPPNMLFNNLNPKIQPFINGLHVPTSLTPWPQLPEGVPKRVSVNSFGFGGSNAHAILEEYRRPSATSSSQAEAAPRQSFAPFVFSAVSEASLTDQLQAYSEHLKTFDDTNPADLSWTLRSRRSQFAVKTAFPASTISQLTANIDAKLADRSKPIGVRTKPTEARILGVFTGQGAQWPAMGAELIKSSAFVAQRVLELEDSLSSLPLDPPDWSLRHEMLKGADTSRIAEARMSQPLCTAVQIVLVDLLRAAGITFKAVVGHSSGEIGASYAAGFLSATDAIRTAYYRGVYAKLAGNPKSGQKGAMLAVGTSMEDAEELIGLRAFRGKIAIAAHNSSASVTLSGDADAIAKAKNVFDEEKKFARALKVDTAYHSPHMLPCGDAYMHALRTCGVKVIKDRDTNCSWYSSVKPSHEPMESTTELQDTYWRDNMANTVLFADAIKNAVNSDSQLSFVLEVGPHPALQGPSVQNIADVRSTTLPYSGVLSRGKSDVESFSQALGNVWTYLGSQGVNFESFEKTISPRAAAPQLVIGLPSYSWNHSKSSLYESRKSRKIRGRKQAFHEILGVPSPDNTARDKRWGNVLKVSEIQWLEGHQLQGQSVFPAAGYVAMAIEAARSLAQGNIVEVFELTDLAIPRAITFEDDGSGVETLVTLTAIQDDKASRTTTADFSCYSCPANGTEQELELMASCSVKVVFGLPSMSSLPSTKLDVSNMVDVDTDRFYGGLDRLGYGYSGPFRTMSSLKRRYNSSSVLVESYAYADDDATRYLVHPTWLDVAFQASMLAYSAPGDERLWSLHVPTSISSIRINPEVCASLPFSSTARLPVCSTLADTDAFCASIDIFNEDADQAMVQVEELTIKPFAPATAADDRQLFSYTKWDLASPDGPTVVAGCQPSSHEIELAAVCERVSYYYIRKWKAELTDDEWANGQPHHAALRNYMNHMLCQASTGKHPTLRREWSWDTASDIKGIVDAYPNDIDLMLLSAVGENIPAAVRGETTILEHMLPNNMLDDYYKYGLGFARYNSFLAGMMEQIVHRYPHAKILEIGAGTGGATKAVLDKIGHSWSSYTYTDVSVGFFEKAAQLFSAHSDRMIFKTLDIEKTPSTQGYENGAYDIVIASNVLHATQSLQKTLTHTRQLLKPGGRLMLLELTNKGPLRFSNIMGGLPGWWAGVDDGRYLNGPIITPGEWHTALRKAGFTGVEAITPEVDGTTWPFSIMEAQATDDRVSFLRRPLVTSASSSPISIESLVILGTQSLQASRIAEEIEEHLGRFCGQVTLLAGLPTKEEELSIPPMSTFINLVDLDSPIFKSMTQEKMDGLNRLYELASHILWITVGAVQGDEPYQMSSIAFSRAMSHEAGHISMNHLDISEIGDNTPKAISEYLLRQCALDMWEDNQKLAWSKEPEAFLDHGMLKIPRLRDNEDQNGRLNSTRRIITKKVPASSPNISVALSEDSAPALVEQVLPAALQHTSQGLVFVDESSLTALCVAPDTYLYLSRGLEIDGKETVIALSTTNAREIAPIAKISAPADKSLVGVVSELLAASLLRPISTGSSLLVHCSGQDALLARALARRAQEKDIRITFTYNAKATDISPDRDWIKLDARTPRHTVRKILSPANVSHLLILDDTSDALGINITSAVSSTCRRIDLSDITRHQAFMPSSEQVSTDVQTALNDAVHSAAHLIQNEEPQSLVMELSKVREAIAPSHPTSIVKWSTEGTVEVDVRPLDGQRMFSSDKTYLLVGLSGEIGRSLTEWMVSNGAGCVCLTSRAPKINKTWLDSFEHTNATVKVFATDVTDKSSLERVVKEIKATCPPIAGVANGAMVLEDTLLSKMSAEVMQKVLGPKIDGSNNLDEIFYNDPLDFFVLFSSSACIIGNSGQSNYAAANGYLNGLSKQRRKRGLAASVVDIGRVAGIGYVETAGQAVLDQLTRFGLMAISESEFRQMFAETILAGYTDHKTRAFVADPVVTTGIRKIRDDEDIQGPWFDNPRFSHCIIETKSVAAGSGSSDKKTSAPVTEQLASATSKEEAQQILQECFLNKLRIILQLADAEIDAEAPLVELGVDSLVAVEVRSWFLKEIKVDVPVLKVVGGASPVELCELAVKKLPDEMLPNLGGEKQAAPKPAAPKIEAPKKAKVPPKVVIPKSAASGSSTKKASSAGHTSSDSEGEPTTAAYSSTGEDEDSAPLTPISLPSSPSSPKLPPSKELAEIAKKPAIKFIKSGPMSFGQSRFWFLRLLLEDQTTSNVAFYYHIAGALRIGDMERAIRVVTNRHESLRTAFVEDDAASDQAFQKVMASSPLRLERKKVNSLEEVRQEYHKLQQTIFNLENGDLFRLVLCSLSSTSHYLLVVYHHILMDGVSFQIFLSDLEKAYNGQSLGKAPRQYLEHSKAQRQAYDNGDMKDELAYWRSVFPAGEEPPVLPLLPMARMSSRMTMKNFGVNQVGCHLEPALAARVKAVSRANRSTPMHFYLAAFKAMLFSFTEAQDLTIGIADANRNDSEVMGSIGFFLNLLTLRFRRDPDQTFAAALAEARNTAYAALGNSRLPFDILLKELNVARSSTHSPFFQAFFDYRQGAQEKHPWGNVQFEFQEVHPGRTAYDITLDVTESGNDALVMFRTQKALYDDTAANLLLDTFVHFVDVLSGDATLQQKDIPLFGEKQLAKAIEVGRGPKLTSDWPGTLPHRIDQVAKENADKVALVDGIGRDLTYADMIDRIESIGEALQNAGVGPDSRVLVYQTASSDWICSMLAIMRIGAIYVPLDLRNPIARLAAVAQDCQPSAILVDSTTTPTVAQLGVDSAKVVDINKLGARPSARVPNCAQANQPAAILYTSGSTGLPKGIVVKHSGLRNEIEGYTKTWHLGAERALQQSAYTFNHSSDQIYTGLVNGGTVFTVPWEKRGDPIEITKMLKENKITYTKATPSEYSLWMQFGQDNLREAKSWRRAFGGGEDLTTTVTHGFASLDLAELRVFNSYGPTEISISSTKMEVDYRTPRAPEERRIPCGFPLPNYHKYIVDADFKPVPPGVPGELCIGGAGVSLGYLNNEELTAKHFVDNPFATAEDVANGWTRLYKTGDLVHLQDNGAMVFHSRIAGDSQVKIRGLRIELADIESNIVATAAGALKEAVVTLREGDPDFLVAHVVFAPEFSDLKDKDAFLAHLLSELPVPQYMVPVAAFPLDSFPLTNHSKVDRKALQTMALPERTTSAKADDQELTQTMIRLKQIWQDVLGNKELGFDIAPSTSFFAVGGNSLLVIRLQAKIREVFDVVLRLVDLLELNKLNQMARKIDESLDVGLIDWDEETAPPTIPSSLLSLSTAANKSKTGKTVLVTGATGFLGRRLIPQLVDRTDIAHVHCVAVRDVDSRTLPSDNAKVSYHSGDLTLPQLGLSDDKFKMLATEVDIILHMGAARSFWDNYHSLRSINVQPTKEIIKLAAPRQIPVHYISSLGVLPRDVPAKAGSASKNVPDTSGAEGYVATRWASERVLERSTETLGVPTFVYRFLQSTSKPSPKEQLDELVRFVDETGIMPEMKDWEGRIDMAPAQQIVEQMTRALLNDTENAAATSFTHYESPITVNVADLREHLEKARGDRDLKREPGLKWIGRIKALGWDYFLTSQEATVGNGSEGAGFESRR